MRGEILARRLALFRTPRPRREARLLRARLRSRSVLARALWPWRPAIDQVRGEVLARRLALLRTPRPGRERRRWRSRACTRPGPVRGFGARRLPANEVRREIAARQWRRTVRRIFAAGNRPKQAGRPLQPFHFGRRQVAVLACLETRVTDRAEPDAAQPHHRVPDGVAHVAHLPRPAFANHEGDDRLVLAGTKPRFRQPHGGGSRPLAVERDPAPQTFDAAVVRYAAHLRVILAFHLVAWMQQALGQRAVVGEDQQALGVVIQPTDRVHVLADVGDEIDDRRPLLGVLPCRHVAPRLVQQDVAVLGGHMDARAIHADVVGGRVRLRAERGDRGAVDRHAAVGDQLFGRPSRGDARRGEDLL